MEALGPSADGVLVYDGDVDPVRSLALYQGVYHPAVGVRLTRQLRGVLAEDAILDQALNLP